MRRAAGYVDRILKGEKAWPTLRCKRRPSMSREGAWLSVVVRAFGDAWRALDTMTRLIEQIDSVTTERLRTLARTVRYGTEGPSTKALPPQVLVTSDPSGKALKDVDWLIRR